MNEVVIKVIGNYSYQTSRCLGEGVYGKVYEGTERQTKEKVAIKKIDLATFTNDKYLQNAIFNEIYLLKRFNHPNIVRFKDVLSSKNSLYIITEYCKNGDLKQLIKRKRFREEDVFEVMTQIMNGFTQLVKQKIIHRDLKPANILIHDGVYKIGDFGFAKYVDNFGSQMLKSCVGSPIYMAPQILERTQYTTKCDVWSMGIIFYEMIFGYPPWKARDQYQLLRGIKTIPITRIIKRESLSSRACQFLKRTLAYSEEERIGWNQLFEMFTFKVEPKIEIPDNKSHSSNSTNNNTLSSKERTRTTPSSNNVSTNNWTQNANSNTNTNKSNNNGPTIMTSVTTSKGQVINSPERKRASMSGTYSNDQLESVGISRQLCIYYSFFCVELFGKYRHVKNVVGSHELFGKLLLLLGLNLKSRSAYCLSSISYKESKSLEELHRKMKQEHESYDGLYGDITAQLEREGLLRKLRDQLSLSIGRSDIINEEKLQKIQNQLIKCAHENAQVLSDDIRRKGKLNKDIITIEILDFVIDVLSLGIGKAKALQEIKDAPRFDDDDLKDYLSRVVGKLEKLTVNF